MWFIFPQLRGLGRSATAQYYGIGSRSEALRYVQHPVLGARLRECVEQVLSIEGCSAHAIFGSPDELKFRSSMTLFAAVAADEPCSSARSTNTSAANGIATLELLRSAGWMGVPCGVNQGSRMSELIVDKGWLSGTAGSFIQLNSITGLRIAPSRVGQRRVRRRCTGAGKLGDGSELPR